MDITLANVSKRFGSYPAAIGVDLTVRSGELLALLGPSGSGKTTLLRLLAGLETPDDGTIRFGPVDASTLSLRERQVGFVFQHYALFRNRTVFENVAFGLRVRPRRERPDNAEIRRRVDRLLDLVQIGELAGRYPGQISGGQRQRVALARALAIEPKVLLLDEPFGALDAQVRKDLRRWLRRLHEEIHVTSVFVTHDQEEALELADRVVVMAGGRVEQVGAAEEIYQRPASAFVYGFIGEAAGLDVRIHDGAVVWNDRRLPISAEGPDGPARLFLRPHEVVLGTEGAGLNGTIRHLRPRGPARRAEILLDDGISVLEADLPDDIPLEVGDSVPISARRWGLFRVEQGGR